MITLFTFTFPSCLALDLSIADLVYSWNRWTLFSSLLLYTDLGSINRYQCFCNVTCYLKSDSYSLRFPVTLRISCKQSLWVCGEIPVLCKSEDHCLASPVSGTFWLWLGGEVLKIWLFARISPGRHPIKVSTCNNAISLENIHKNFFLENTRLLLV